MKKSGLVLIVLVLFLVPVVHAGFFGWLKGVLTGSATSATTTTNITISNQNIDVWNVSSISAQSATEGGVTNFIFTVNVADPDGTGNIQNVRATMNQTGEPSRTNQSCVAQTTINTTVRTYHCTLGFYYYDASGTWNINVSANDAATTPTTDQNISQTVSINTLTSWVMGPTSLTWGTVNLLSTNQTSNNDPMLLNNTGNQNITIVRVTGINLFGETTYTGNNYINVTNMSTGIATGGSPPSECGILLRNNTAVTVTSSTLPRGNFSINAGGVTSGQEQLYFCLNAIDPTTTQQSYSTANSGLWTVSTG